MNGRFYINNGHVVEGPISGSLAAANALMDDLFNGPGELISQALDMQPARFNRSECSGSFPPSSKYVDTETKELHIDVALCGVSEDEMVLDVENDIIKLSIEKTEEAKKSRLYSQKGLKLATNEELCWKYDPRYHDINKMDVVYNNGLLSITVQPREELKPVTKHLFGNLVKKDDEAKSEAETSTETETKDADVSE